MVPHYLRTIVPPLWEEEQLFLLYPPPLWEEDIPRRIDLGKNRYGGPFTNEEVEDTKTFLRILPLLLCLFGYHLAGDGYSAPEQLHRTSCPSLPVLILIVYNPLHMSTLVSVVCIDW